jgi:hypothetical protein
LRMVCSPCCPCWRSAVKFGGMSYSRVIGGSGFLGLGVGWV